MFIVEDVYAMCYTSMLKFPKKHITEYSDIVYKMANIAVWEAKKPT